MNFYKSPNIPSLHYNSIIYHDRLSIKDFFVSLFFRLRTFLFRNEEGLHTTQTSEVRGFPVRE